LPVELQRGGWRRPPGAYRLRYPRRAGSAAPHDTRPNHAPRTHLPHANILYTVRGRFRKFVAGSVLYGKFGFGHW
jgi:hypothetical protein